MLDRRFTLALLRHLCLFVVLCFLRSCRCRVFSRRRRHVFSCGLLFTGGLVHSVGDFTIHIVLTPSKTADTSLWVRGRLAENRQGFPFPLL